jgi:hypothetical protein
MARRGRLRPFLLGLIKFLALVLVAGGIGVALGIGLTRVSGDDESAGRVGAGATTAQASGDSAPIPTATAAATPPPTPTATATTPPPPPTTATTTATPSVSPNPPARVRVKVLDARLFTDKTPSGTREQRARVTVRIRIEDTGAGRLTLTRPTLRVGRVRIPAVADAHAPGSRSDPLRPGVAQTVTLRFALAGEATPKVVRDRRARVLIAGRSVAVQVKVRTTTR